MDKTWTKLLSSFTLNLKLPRIENEANQQLLSTLWQPAQQADFTHLKVMMMVEQMQKL
jgi:hypothetical protein